ncbi:hypothetical protein IPZ64_31320 [Streptomyces violaceoruber]|uniref:hypothetical protein n=1 Tax=Streptomyces violaceoruber TaxID=1935 RepID=UPI001F41C7F6|nr:hypothetical protein [Streptomyces violaceoruber]MCF3171344.1 hypothetical protein [Streptomyces violaceoruber]
MDAPDAPEEGSDAGPAADLQQAHLEAEIRAHRRRAKQAFRDAQRLVAKDKVRASAAIKAALLSAARAFWWAEDSEMEEQQHRLMHEIGKWKHKALGCALSFSEGNYSQRCPVAIAHKRMGISIGFTATRFCSICREDVSSDRCLHFRDRSYWVRGGADATGPCRVCSEKECKHRHDTLYRARVVYVVDERSGMQGHEVSIVRKPAYPDSRFVEMPIEIDDLAGAFGPNFLPGVRVSCDQCLSCPGFVEFPPDL